MRSWFKRISRKFKAVRPLSSASEIGPRNVCYSKVIQLYKYSKTFIQDINYYYYDFRNYNIAIFYYRYVTGHIGAHIRSGANNSEFVPVLS